MAAVFNIMFDFGGSDTSPGTEQIVDDLGPPNIRFKTADDATIDTNNPIPIPTSGTKYSYWKQIYMKCTTAPSTKVDNVKFYTDSGGFGTGITVKVGTETPDKHSGAGGNDNYEIATGTPGDSGNEMTAGHAGLSGSSDAFGYTSASPKTLTISEDSFQIDAIGEMTDYLIFQMEVISSASPGDLANETWTIKYDEV